jgi:hypothetical protein
MEYDANGAIAIAEAAIGFDWTWTPRDLRRFAETAGWTILDLNRFGAVYETGLNVRMAKASTTCDSRIFKRKRTIHGSVQSIAAYPADFKDEPRATGAILQARTFAELGERRTDVLGAGDTVGLSQEIELSWSFPGVVIALYSGSGHITLELRNPRYHEWLLSDREDQRNS